MAVDHLNIVERKLIDNLRAGTYNTAAGTSTAWSAADVTVFGQFPSTDETKYPAIITEMSANGIEEQYFGQNLTFGGSGTAAKGELYGVGFKIHLLVDRDSSITIDGEPYKERRLLNYLMLNCANVLMDTDFSSTNTDVVQRNYTGFQDIGYNPDLEIWAATANMIVVFKNNR